MELLALTPLLKRPIVFGVVGGFGVGTAGLWLESLWVGAVYHYPWPTNMWGEALAMAVPVAVLMGVCGALLGVVLTGQRLPRPAVGITVVVLTMLVIAGAVGNGLRGARKRLGHGDIDRPVEQQSLRQEVGRNPCEGGLQFVVAQRTGKQFAHDQEDPAVAHMSKARASPQNCP